MEADMTDGADEEEMARERGGARVAASIPPGYIGKLSTQAEMKVSVGRKR